VYRGVRYDTGMPLGYLQAVVQLAAQRPDLGPAFKEWLAGFVASGGKPTGSSE
jgi:UTP--glucose-1-phosphate uridylyltransferase